MTVTAATNSRATDFLRALEVFLAVAESRSMTAAARGLGMAQSAVSQTLQQLEGELGQSLFDRSVRPLSLTSAGGILRTRALQLVTDAAETRSLVREMGSGALPHLRLAVIGSLAGTLVPPLIGALSDSLPIGHISVWRGHATSNENALVTRDVDMLVTSDALYDLAGLDRFALFSEPYVVIAPPGVLADGMPSSVEALAARLPFVRYTRRTQMGWSIESQFKRMGVDVPSTLEFDSSEDVVAMVAGGYGWSVTVPSHVLHGLRHPKAIDTAPFPGPEFRRAVNLVVRAAELGTIPADIHRLCLDVLARDVAPGIGALIPWLGDGFAITGPPAG